MTNKYTNHICDSVFLHEFELQRIEADQLAQIVVLMLNEPRHRVNDRGQINVSHVDTVNYFGQGFRVHGQSIAPQV